MTLEEIEFEDLHPLEYIETTGCEYIDTGYKPNQNTRIVMDIRATSVTANAWAFGGRNSWSSNNLGLFCYFNDKTWRVDYSTSDNRKTFSGVDTYDFLHIDHNKNTTTVNGVTVSNTSTTFQSDYNLCLLANNTAGTIDGYLAAKLYSCKIYDNDTLVRDFIPCLNGQTSNLGLYDRVNKQMYSLAGNVKYTAKEGPEINLAPYNSLQRRRFDTSSKSLDLTPEKYMYIELLEGGTFGINAAPDYIYYAQEGDDEWTPLAPDYPSKSFPAGSKIYVKGELTPSSSYGIGTFSIMTSFNVGGNVMSLLFGDNAKGQTSLAGYDYAFYHLFFACGTLFNIEHILLPATTLSQHCYEAMFQSCGITTVPLDLLPATTLADYCYDSMFYDTGINIAPTLPATTLADYCYYLMFFRTSLTTAPELPATTLADSCYESMFTECASLTTAPTILPATTLANNCYYEMFMGCTSLTTAPTILPATTLADNCYCEMFYGCTSLTTAPELPATTLTYKCYSDMFYSCISLTTAPELPATTLANYCYDGMFLGCTSLTTAPELPATTLADGCYGSMFHGCTKLTTAPELPATTLQSHCYSNMFRNCNSLSTAPVLPATKLDNSCYENMFYNCNLLTTAPVLPATDLANKCYYGMFQDCASLTTAPVLPATDLADSCYYQMFDGCATLTTAPELPATTLANKCYQYMFQYCYSLTTAPVLPATTLANYCYYYMFYKCTSLNYIKMLATDISASNCLTSWVLNVASNGTFVKHPNMTSLTTGTSGIPEGWAVIDEGTGGGGTGGDITLGWTVQSGTWNEESYSSAWDGVVYTCESPGTNGSTVIRYAWSGLTEITFNCVYYGENNYDYLTVGELDTACTRDSYRTSLKGNSGTARSITYSCDTGTHYVEFCYSKDGSSDTSPDNATVYIESVNGSGGSSGGTGSADITWDVQSGVWNEESNSSAYDGVQYVCESPGANGSTVIRCTISGVSGASFVIRSQGESSYDYLNAGELDSSCTRDSYKMSLSGNQENNVAVGYTFGDYGTHYVEFCYSKDSSVDTPPDNGVVYLKELIL